MKKIIIQPPINTNSRQALFGVMHVPTQGGNRPLLTPKYVKPTFTSRPTISPIGGLVHLDETAGTPTLEQ